MRALVHGHSVETDLASYTCSMIPSVLPIFHNPAGSNHACTLHPRIKECEHACDRGCVSMTASGCASMHAAIRPSACVDAVGHGAYNACVIGCYLAWLDPRTHPFHH
jgi:hypothetical protein